MTAACPLLTSDDLKQILGSAALADLKAVEAQPKNENHGSTHTCTYGGESGFALSVLISTDGILTPAQTVKAMTPKDVASHDVPGVGEAATFYQNNGGIGIFSAAKGSHGQNRAVIFAGPAATPEAKFVEVGKLVTDQL